MKRTVLFCLFAIAPFLSFSQNNIKDSIRIALKEKPKFFIGFHNRNTFIQTDRTKLYGLIGGFEFNKKVKLYAGIYGFGKEDETLIVNSDVFPNTDSVLRFQNTSNFSIGAEYSYYHKNRITLSIPIQVGIGSLEYQYENKSSVPLDKEFFTYMPIEFGTNAYFELLPWAGIKTGIGYRIQVGRSEAAKLSSPYYNLGLAILVGKLYQEIIK